MNLQKGHLCASNHRVGRGGQVFHTIDGEGVKTAFSNGGRCKTIDRLAHLGDALNCHTIVDGVVSCSSSRRVVHRFRIGDFQCENAVTAQAVRNVFIEVISLRGDVKLVREGEADVVIEGTVTSGQAGSSSGHIAGGPNWLGGKSQGVGGDYVSGVTALVLRDGQIWFSASWGQVMSKGSELLPPELVARRTAERLLGTLYKDGMKRK